MQYCVQFGFQVQLLASAVLIEVAFQFNDRIQIVLDCLNLIYLGI